MSEHRISGLELRTALARLNAAEDAIAEVKASLAALTEESLSTPTVHLTPVAPQQAPMPALAGPRPYPTVRQGPPPPRQAPPPPTKPRKPPLTLEQKVMRGIAIGGAVITLIGVALLIALAIQLGLLGPLARVIGTALLATILLGIGIRQIMLEKPNTTGANALIITSYLIYSLLTVTLVHWLEWWPELLGAVVLIIIHSAYLGMARYFHMEWLSYVVAAIGGILALTYFDAAPDTWAIASLPLITLASTYRSNWGWTRMIAALAMVLLHLSLLGTWQDNLNTFGAILATVSALALLWVNLQDPLPEEGEQLPRPRQSTNEWISQQEPLTLSHRLIQLGLAAALLPLISLNADDTYWVWLSPIAAFGFLLMALKYGERASTVLSLSALPLTFLPLWWLTQHSPLPLQEWEGPSVIMVFLGVGILMVWWLSRQESFGRSPWVCWLAATLLITASLGYGAAFREPLVISGYQSIILALLLAAFITRVLLSARVFSIFDTWEQVSGGIATLYLSMLVVVTLSTNVDFYLGGDVQPWTGYYFGHALVSIIWMVLAAWVLLARNPLNNDTALGIGLILAVSATVKLVFFDLSALSGVPRVFAFLVCGVVLLAIATIRSRRSTEPEQPKGAAEVSSPSN
ncbi:hypothetical protein COCCU_06560 [Corynebacterium occultum]|uniref:DUF2339 domain-containing protein n=1 Tax=Corynebacterium occultum TaxID=2675219 RepID=A0A6B8WB62_9CORY|nr:DUF2339 domain-containing protein [Corynebacterium occultum]QGU07250.1 hypothetical protein COCCU_06560 [Corynebacterium occultum]